MNTTSDPVAGTRAPARPREGKTRAGKPRLWIAASVIALAACIQGPWDYYPDNPPPFRGISVTGYALAGRPITHVCFERLLDLAEEATQAFAFYDSADVRITGRFGGEVKTLGLTAVTDTPNCFKGDSASLVERGASYDLAARMVWDSAGTRVASRLSATARVPTSFSVHRDAVAPGLAKTGGVPENVFTPEFIGSLSPKIQAAIAEAYGDTLAKLAGDTAAQARFARSDAGKGFQAFLLDLLQNDQIVYKEGDTLFYLNGALNTLSHYFSCDRSPDVQSVLITQRFERNSSRPETRFDSPFGGTPDSSDYYFPGEIRRLLIYPDAKGGKGYNLLDSMGVVNVWFHTQRNRLYFYGMEAAYYAYLSTVTQVQGGGGGDADPRVKPKYNVTGGNGIFVGGIPDSFDVVIEVDSLTKSYPLPIVHGLFCEKEGWLGNQDCREYYRAWCSERQWQPASCGLDAVRASLEAGFIPDSAALGPRAAPRAESIGEDSILRIRAERQFCVERNFPEAGGVCAAPKIQCLETKGMNDCKSALWAFCQDHAWRPEQCIGPGIASYCHDKPRLSETLCRNADAWCAANPGSELCK